MKEYLQIVFGSMGFLLGAMMFVWAFFNGFMWLATHLPVWQTLTIAGMLLTFTGGNIVYFAVKS